MSKKNDIKKYIQVFALNTDIQHEILIKQIKVALLVEKKSLDAEKVYEKVWNAITSNAYIEKFVDVFDRNFTHNEIKYLLEFYTSDVMKKYASMGQPIFTSMFDSFFKTVQKIVQETC